MEVTLYLDVLFIIDFSMDLLSLYFTGCMTHIHMKPSRLSFASSAGAAASVIAVLISPGPAVDAIISLGAAAAMCLIAFGRAPGAVFLQRASILWAVGLLLGGIMTVFSSFGTNSDTGTVRHSHVFFFILPAAAISMLLFRSIGKTSAKKHTMVKVTAFGNCVEWSAIVDSGNLLADPFTGEPVIVAARNSLSRVLDIETLKELFSFTSSAKFTDSDLSSRIRLIPASDVSGELLLPAFRPESVMIGDKRCRALIAAAPSEADLSPGIDCIVPQNLIT